MTTWAEVEPWLATIIEKIFKAKVAQCEPYPGDWVIWVGPALFHGLWSVQPDLAIKVGLRQGDLSVSERGKVGGSSILGIPVAVDDDGPPHLWRLSDPQGRTLTWGEV